jgi:ABC-type Fe3+/spermidine/putrescine transport system ATPase subunit
MSELNIHALTVGYGSTSVLQQVNLGLASGEYACLLGRSGSGKSTLLGTIAGFVEPTQGLIKIGDSVVFDRNENVYTQPQHRGLGMVFQEPTLWPHLSVIDNILFPLRSRGMAAKPQHAEDLLGRVGLGGLGQRKPAALSGGQRQRVAICRALASRPALVLLDEPLSAVDSLSRGELRHYLHQLFLDTGTTALHVTHDPSEAFALARHVGVIDQGCLVQWATPETLYHHPESEVVAGLTGAFSIVEVMAELIAPGMARIRFDDRDWVCPAHSSVRSGKATLLLRPESVHFSDQPGAWQLTNRRFDSGSFHIAAEHANGHRVHGLCSKNPPQNAVTLDLVPDRCWVIPGTATV